MSDRIALANELERLAIEAAARDIWVFFKSFGRAGEGAGEVERWFDKNKQLGGPKWLIERLSALRGEQDKPAEGKPVTWPDREAAIEAAARAYHVTHFAPRAETFNGKPCVAFERLIPELQASHRKHVTPIVDAMLALPARDGAAGFQERVGVWMLECFGPIIPFDKVERNDRFIEEALELTQATGYSAERAHALVDYVFGRPIGEPSQEVGGVMVTLAALCNVHGLDFTADGLRELDRIEQPAIMAKIKAKQAAKPTGSALPSASDGAGQVGEVKP